MATNGTVIRPDEHVIKREWSPNVKPTALGQEWIDRVGKRKWTSFGTASLSDWKENSLSGVGIIGPVRVDRLLNYDSLAGYVPQQTNQVIEFLCAEDYNAGGGGTFVVDENDTTTALDGGTVLALDDGRRVKRQYSGPFNVRWFGAYGNGVHEDTAAFTAALAALQQHSESVGIFIPAGSYRVSDTLRVNVIGTTISGVGETVSNVLFYATDRDAFSIKADHVTFENFGIWAEVLNTKSAIALNYVGPSYVSGIFSFRNLKIVHVGGATGWGCGIRFENNPAEGTPYPDGKFYSSHNEIHNLFIAGVMDAGIHMADANIVVNTTDVKNCAISGRETWQGENAAGIRVRQFQAIKISSCSFQKLSKGIEGPQVASSVCGGIEIINNYFEAFTVYGIEMVCTTTQVTGRMASCYFAAGGLLIGPTGACIKIQNWSGFLDMASMTIFDADINHKDFIGVTNPRCLFFNGFKDASTAAGYSLGDIAPLTYLNGNFGFNRDGPAERVEVLQDAGDAEGTFSFSVISAPGQTKLALGARSAAQYSFVQSLQNGASLTNRPLVIQPFGGNCGVGGVPNEKLEILKDSDDTAEGTFGLSLLSLAGQTKLAFGTRNAAAYSFIQSMQHGASFTNRPLKLQPQGGNLDIGGPTLPARMTKVARNALTAVDGMVIFQTDNTPGLRIRQAGAWVSLTTSADP